MNPLGITRGEHYSTIYIHGNPPCGLSTVKWSALGELAHATHNLQAQKLTRNVENPRSYQGSGWSITAPTEDIDQIYGAAESILNGSYTQLATYRNGA